MLLCAASAARTGGSREADHHMQRRHRYWARLGSLAGGESCLTTLRQFMAADDFYAFKEAAH